MAEQVTTELVRLPVLRVPLGLCQCGCGSPTVMNTKDERTKGWERGQYRQYVKNHNLRNPKPEYIKNDETGCWEWQRYLDRNGYGHGTKRGGSALAHRIVYERHRGPIPKGLQLDHLCRNPRCVNPDHLEPVTNAENSRRGDMTRLTVEQVREIRASDEPSNKKLAAKYGVHPVYIWQIKARRKWRDV